MPGAGPVFGDAAPNESLLARPRGVAVGPPGVVNGMRFLSGEEATETRFCCCRSACFFFSRIADRIELVPAEVDTTGAVADFGRGTGMRGLAAAEACRYRASVVSTELMGDSGVGEGACLSLLLLEEVLHAHDVHLLVPDQLLQLGQPGSLAIEFSCRRYA